MTEAWTILCNEYHAIKDEYDKVALKVMSQFAKGENPLEEELDKFINPVELEDVKQRMHEYVKSNRKL